jgi:hypothetical protein
MSIHDFKNKIKGHGQYTAFGLILLAGCGLSFYMGYSARAKVAEAAPVIIQCPKTAYVPTAFTLAPTKATLDAERAVAKATGVYVASKTGKKYYPADCAAGQRIKDANKVYFNTSAAAVLAGYESASNCK